MTVALEGMHFYAFHGYYDEEQLIGNDFILDVYAYIPSFDSHEDNINDTVNYEDVYLICQEVMKTKYRLLESVVMYIAEKLKSKFPFTEKITVRLSKIGPQLGGSVDKAVITYEI